MQNMVGSVHAAWLETPMLRPRLSIRFGGPAKLRHMLDRWRDRIRFRWDLAQMAKANPHLIADIGLTERQAEAEIAKPFWRG